MAATCGNNPLLVALAGVVWRCAALTLCIRDPHKEEKMAAIHDALEKCSVEEPVFYEDEIDIHLNPKIMVI